MSESVCVYVAENFAKHWTVMVLFLKGSSREDPGKVYIYKDNYPGPLKIFLLLLKKLEIES